jgi:hypothetical protein
LTHLFSWCTASIRCHGSFQEMPSIPGVEPPLLVDTRFTALIRKCLFSKISRCSRCTPTILDFRYSTTSWFWYIIWVSYTSPQSILYHKFVCCSRRLCSLFEMDVCIIVIFMHFGFCVPSFKRPLSARKARPFRKGLGVVVSRVLGSVLLGYGYLLQCTLLSLLLVKTQG